jgi:hypothetical protein
MYGTKPRWGTPVLAVSLKKKKKKKNTKLNADRYIVFQVISLKTA